MLAELDILRHQIERPVQERLTKALCSLITATCKEPELGMFLTRIGAERGTKIKFLLDTLIRPYHDALLPLLKEAMREGIVPNQPSDILCFMLTNAISITVSYRHILADYEGDMRSIESLAKSMNRCVLKMLFAR